MEPTNNVSDYIVGAGKLAPSAAVTGMTAAGISLQDWTYITTLAYTVLMIVHLVYKWIKERRGS